MVFFLKPAVATVLAVIFLGEKISTRTMLGMALVAIGILINFYKKAGVEKELEEG